ncbi:MAG: hypothetical protein LBE75_04995 [Burkholderiales bacterium]|nr:hypothetical protein [Burkholderiales bacterium]
METKYLVFFCCIDENGAEEAIDLPDGFPHLTYSTPPLIPRIGELVALYGKNFDVGGEKVWVVEDVIHEITSQSDTPLHVIRLFLSEDKLPAE